ncbi:hypothetical protein PGB90_001174 [Kerria lacca]
MYQKCLARRPKLRNNGVLANHWIYLRMIHLEDIHVEGPNGTQSTMWFKTSLKTYPIVGEIDNFEPSAS